MTTAMRLTSLEAILALRREKVLEELQAAAWHALAENGPLTGKELAKVMSRPDIHKRLSEVKRLGLMTERGVRKCRVTGRNAIAWDAVPPDASRDYHRPRRRTWWIFIGDDGEAQLLTKDGDKRLYRNVVDAGCGELVRVRELSMRPKHKERSR